MGIIGLVIAPLVATLLLIVGLVLVRARSLPSRAADPPGLRTFASFAGGREHDADTEGTTVDPATWGRGLLDTILDQFHPLDIAGDIEKPVVEVQDYGASFALVLDGAPHRVHLGHVGDDPEEWLLSVETDLRGAPKDGPELRRALLALDAALRKTPDVRDIHWHRREAWSASDIAAWKPSPLDDNATAG